MSISILFEQYYLIPVFIWQKKNNFVPFTFIKIGYLKSSHIVYDQQLKKIFFSTKNNKTFCLHFFSLQFIDEKLCKNLEESRIFFFSKSWSWTSQTRRILFEWKIFFYCLTKKTFHFKIIYCTKKNKISSRLDNRKHLLSKSW